MFTSPQSRAGLGLAGRALFLGRGQKEGHRRLWSVLGPSRRYQTAPKATCTPNHLGAPNGSWTSVRTEEVPPGLLPVRAGPWGTRVQYGWSARAGCRHRQHCQGVSGICHAYGLGYIMFCGEVSGVAMGIAPCGVKTNDGGREYQPLAALGSKNTIKLVAIRCYFTGATAPITQYQYATAWPSLRGSEPAT